MLTVDGLFGAGDTVGGSAHKFSSGSFTEGRLAAKAAVKYIEDKKAEGIKVNEKQYNDLKEEIYTPLENYTVGRNEITGGTVSPSYISPIQGLQRLQRIMDEYVGGIATNYMTNEKGDVSKKVTPRVKANIFGVVFFAITAIIFYIIYFFLTV
jgi:adenylylsulfate reductase subunit A